MTTSTNVLFQKLASGGLLFISIFLFICTGRVLLDGKRHVEQAEALHRSSHTEAAFAELEDAARAYFPGSPFPRQALIKMEIMSKSMQMRGHTQKAKSSFEKMRRSILSTRHFVQPNEDLLQRVEAALIQIRKTNDKTQTDDQALPLPKDPNPFASMLLALGMIVWISASAGLCLISGNVSENRQSRSFLWILTIGGLILWIVMAWISQ